MTAQKAKNDSAIKLPIKPHGVLCAPSTRERELKKKKRKSGRNEEYSNNEQPMKEKQRKKTHFEQCDTRTESQKEKSKRWGKRGKVSRRKSSALTFALRSSCHSCSNEDAVAVTKTSCLLTSAAFRWREENTKKWIHFSMTKSKTQSASTSTHTHTHT